MATKKGKATKKRTRRNPVKRHAAPRRASHRRPTRRNPSRGPVAGFRRKHQRRRATRRNPDISTADWKKLGMATAVAAVGGFAGVAATTALESHVSQPPRTLGLIKLAAAALGLYVGAKMKQPLAGIAFAGAMGASAGKDLVSSFQAPAPSASAPAVGAGQGATGGALPPGAGGDDAAAAAAQQQADMAAVMDDEDADMDGADGMAAVYDDDEDDDDAYEDDRGDFENQKFDRAFGLE